MNFLQENFFSSTSFDRTDHIEQFVSATALTNHPVPTKLTPQVAALIDASRKTDALIHRFTKLDGGTNLAAPIEGIVIADAKHLAFVFRMTPGPRGYEQDAVEVRPEVGPSVTIYLDVQHNHHDAFRFLIPMEGKSVAKRSWATEGSLVSDNQQVDVEGEVTDWTSECRHFDGIWHLLLRVNRKALGIAPTAQRPIIGLQLRRNQPVDMHLEESLWNPIRVWPPIAPSFGELRLAPQPVTVHKIDLRNPVHGLNRGTFTVSNSTTRPLRLICRTTTNAPSGKLSHLVAYTLPPRAKRNLLVPYETNIYDWKHQYIDFHIELADGSLVYQTQYNAGSCYAEKFGAAYLLLQHRLPANVKRNQPNPKPGEANYYEKKRLYILSRIPDYHRDLSDRFRWFRGYIGKKEVVAFDLSKGNVMDKIARHIESLFTDDDDRVLAALFLVHQSAHWSPSLGNLGGYLNSLSIFRFGLHCCGEYVYVLSGLLSRLTEKRTGKPFAAHYCCSDSHVICALSRGDDHVLLDPNLGFFCPSPDQSTLATVKDHLAHPDIAKHITPGRVNDYHKFPRRLFLPRVMHHFHALGEPAK